jgi:hypothetical protein
VLCASHQTTEYAMATILTRPAEPGLAAPPEGGTD